MARPVTVLFLSLLFAGVVNAGTCPAPATGAFTGCYYSNQTLSGDPAFVRTDSQINFYWGNDSPDRSLPPLDFSIRWQGNFNFDQGNYMFTAITSDGMRLYVDGNLIIDSWRDQPPDIYAASQTVSQGMHLIVVEYYEHLGGATAQLTWQGSAPAAQAPVISSFTATPAGSAPGQPVTLTWVSTGADSLVIDNGVGDVTGLSSVTVVPTQNTSYTLTAHNSTGDTARIVSVTVGVAAGGSGRCPPPASNAFTGCYFNNTNLSGDPVLVTTDKRIDFYWGNESPDPSVTPLGFSARWQGNFNFDQGNYTFSVITSDGMRLYLDGNLIINQWRDQPPFMYTASQTVPQGTHLIVVEYYERLGGATAQVSWEIVPQANAQLPVISSFRAAPPNTLPSQPVALSWTVTGATSINIDGGVGDVTNRSTVTVQPSQSTVYSLTAHNSAGDSTATVSVTISQNSDQQPPTVPSLISASASSATEADLVWTASTDNAGVAGYQIIRNGLVITSVPGATLSYSDTTVSGSSSYVYAVKAFDAAGNYSAASNTIQVTTPVAGAISVKWYGACWQNATIFNVNGNFQSIDFAMTTATPVPLQGTLFFAPNCDASQGQDNLNDFNTLTGTTHMVQGFTHYPDVIPSSALYWIGNRTADGTCPAGAPCSGCVNYTKATLSCNVLP